MGQNGLEWVRMGQGWLEWVKICRSGSERVIARFSVVLYFVYWRLVCRVIWPLSVSSTNFYLFLFQRKDHKTVCKYVLINCANQKCKVKVQHQSMENHVRTCMTSCEYCQQHLVFKNLQVSWMNWKQLTPEKCFWCFILQSFIKKSCVLANDPKELKPAWS